MNTKLRHLIFSSTALLCACESSDDEPFELDEPVVLDEPSSPSAGGPDELTSEQPSATPHSLVECSGTRIMVGILDLVNYPGASCNPVEAGAYIPSGWEWDSMFATGHHGLQISPQQLPAELAKFCMFTYVGENPPQEDDYGAFITAMGEWDEIAEFGPDCMGMAAAGELNGSGVRQSLRAAMLDNIHMPPALPTCSGSNCTEVVVLDTQVGDFVSPGTSMSDHGALVAGIIAAIQGSSWEGEIVYENAFPGSDGESSVLHWDEGGDAGSMATLALALFKANWEFRADLPDFKSPNTHLRSTVNVSLGFLRDLSPGYETSAPAQALHTALRYVSCSGQLVIASAGNNTDEGCPWIQTGGLAPAIYETEPAPSDDECIDLGFEVDSGYGGDYRREPVDPDTYNPLVFAVGGVDSQDRPLPNTREGGQPRLVAYGSDSVGVDFLFDPARVALTGTSSAAASVTAVASTLWSLAPELSGAEIMEIIYTSGYPTGKIADFKLGAEDQPIVRLSYCAALAELCQGRDPLTCPTPTCTARPPAADGYLSAYSQAAQLALGAGTVYDGGLVHGQAPVCEYHDMTQLLLKNPGDPPCPHCNIIKGPQSPPTSDDDQVQMDVISDYKGLIQGASLTVTRFDESLAQYVFSQAVVDALNNPTIATVVVQIDEPNASKAVLHFLIDDPTVGLVTQDNGIVVYENAT